MLRRSKLFVIIVSLILPTLALAGKRNLFDYKDGEITPQLAKSVTKIDGKSYEIVLDLSKEIKKGSALTIEDVKSSVESRLSKSLKAKVIPKDGSKDTIIISFEGEEDTFLERLAKTRIKQGSTVALAANDQKTDAGIRAKAVDEPLAEAEVRVRVLKVKKDKTLLGQVVAAGSKHEKKLKAGKRIKIVPAEGIDLSALQKGDIKVLTVEKDQKSWRATTLK